MAEPNTPVRTIPKAPGGWAILLLIGPSLIWCAEYIGSGEVIIATRTGAILGTTVIWAVITGVFLKFWIGMSGARYTVCTGEGMIDMFARIPGPRNWVVWIVLAVQVVTAAISIGSIAAAAGVFLSSILPIPPYLGGWLIAFLAVAVVWSGVFDVLKIVMSIFVAVTLIGVLYVASHVLPGWAAVIEGLVPGSAQVPQWAVDLGTDPNPWGEILPLLGWGAGGFASQVWYTYWVLGAGYGAASGQPFGKPADVPFLKRLTPKEGRSLRDWCRLVYTDASVAMVIGTIVTMGFLIAGAGILGPNQIAPEGSDVGLMLSQLFSEQWGAVGGLLFLLGGTTALISTQVGQLAGWPRLLADCFRLCIPKFDERFTWKVQFRIFLVFFLFTNMIVVYTLGLRPVFLVKLSAVLDGLLLTPLQALWVGLGLYVVMPKMFQKETYDQIRPHWIFGFGLAVAFLFFGYFCIFQIPNIL